MQVQDFALARQKVVFDVETVHRFKMSTQHGSRNQFCDRRRFARWVFDGMQRIATRLQICFVVLVPLRNAGIQIPAVVVEARLSSERFDFGARFFLDVRETNDHIGHLHTGIVDVILHIHFPARITQQPNKRVSEHRIPQVTDMRRLVGINAGVLDQNLARRQSSAEGFRSATSAAAIHPRSILTFR